MKVDSQVNFRNEVSTLLRVSLREIFLLMALVGVACAWLSPQSVRLPKRTDRKFDVAIFGQGFFQFLDSESGEIVYSRDGHLSLNPEGFICLGSTEDAWILQPAITLRADWTDFHVTRSGTCLVEFSERSQPITIGTIQLTRFINPEGLKEVLPGIYAATATSGTPAVGDPGDVGNGYIQQGWLSFQPQSVDTSYLEKLSVWLAIGLLIWFIIELRRVRSDLSQMRRQRSAVETGLLG